jgi:hypothetical protein
VHGAVKAIIIFFDGDWGIQIADFSPIRMESSAVEPFSRVGSGRSRVCVSPF